MERLNGPIAVLGGGSWGTALAHLLAGGGREVPLLVRRPELALAINTHHCNTRYLPDIPLHHGVYGTTDTSCLDRAQVIVLAVPCQSLRALVQELSPLWRKDVVLVNAAKGLEMGSGLTVSQMLASILADLPSRYAVLSGPSFAMEVCTNKPTAVVLGCADEPLGAALREVFAAPYFRAYSSTDVLGVELGGAVKNVMAIAAGLSDGLGFGHNARSALVSRGLAEMGRLFACLGASPHTLSGLSGLGDLVLTATGDLSRNRQLGLRLGAGETLQSIMETSITAIEGVHTTQALHHLALSNGLDLPIAAAVYGILYENTPVHDAVRSLFERALKAEHTC